MKTKFRLPVADLLKLFDMQNRLDTDIIKKHNLNLSFEEYVDTRKLAFIVELAEYANETRVFKYWSVKSPSEKAVVLEEFVDGVHFLLSLGLLKGYGSDRLPVIEFEFDRDIEYTRHDITKQMLDVVYYAVLLEYTTLFREYIKLGFMWGFTWDEIVQAYKEKHKKNYERQETGTY